MVKKLKSKRKRIPYKRIPEELHKRPGPKGPSKYTPEYLDREADALLEYANNCEMVPFIWEFTKDKEYCSEQLWGFAKSHERLSHAIKKLKDAQAYKLVILSLANKLNAAVAIFTLKNVAGWRDAKEEHKNIQQTFVGSEITKAIKDLEKNQVKSKSTTG